MDESLKDISTTVVGLLAAYFLPGFLALSLITWRKAGVGHFFMQDSMHFILGFLAALSLSFLLNGMRIALFSRFLFREISLNLRGYVGLDEKKLKVLQGAVDEVFRLHQFYSAVFFLFPIALCYFICDVHKHVTWYCVLLFVILGLIAWRAIAVSVLDEYEFYYQVARGALGITALVVSPASTKSWVISLLFEWKFWKPYKLFLE